MKQKIFIVGSFLFAIFFINLFNNFFVSLIYSNKLSTSLDTRNNWHGMCNDIIDFKIKDLKIIFIGDSHIYSGLNLEKFNREIPKLTLTCSIPAISFKNTLNLANQLLNQYDPDLLFVSLSQFQFQIADKKKELEREIQFQKMIKKNTYSFQFNALKKAIIHFIKPYSETEISKKQLKFLESKDEKFFDKFNNSIEYQKKKHIDLRYNDFTMAKQNKKLIEDFCKFQRKNVKKIVFLNLPTPNYLNENLIHQSEYENLISYIGECFSFISHKEVNYLNNKKYYLDRLGEFEKKKLLEYDIAHLNFAGAYLFTEFLVNYINKNYIKKEL